LDDIDIALTTRELARMISRAGIRFTDLPDEEFDPAFGISTGAGVLFGATGGVMEAALRTVVKELTGKEVDNLDFTDVRGVAGRKEAVYNVAGTDVKVCAVSGLTNVRRLLEDIRDGKAEYHFIEVMCCPGGCVNGGGQPLQPPTVRNFEDLRALRAKAIYDQDKRMPLRRSHENPIVQTLYKEILGEPGGHTAHEWLHTTYKAKPKYRV
jgi:NADP-reducing hydrogenase subunit HndD